MTLEQKLESLERDVLRHVVGKDRLAVVKAPPGSGKTSLLIKAALHGLAKKMRIAVGAQTNSQADDACNRLAQQGAAPVRFTSSSYDPPDLHPSATQISDKNVLPHDECIVIGTIAKWGSIELLESFDLLIVDEAWQMAWASFMPCGQVAERFVLIGDPGQIPPVVTVDTSRWETAPRPPHRPAPEIVVASQAKAAKFELPGSRRLPHDTVEYVRGFYDFSFDAWANPAERKLATKKKGNGDGIDVAIDLMDKGSIALLTLPTPAHGPPLELDEGLSKTAVAVAERLLSRGASITIADDKRNPNERKLEPEDIGIVATHRIVNADIELRLPTALHGRVRVDTPERWQGLERAVMIAVHPLSGVTDPTSFDLETGRLCVMASRHKVALFMLARDHIVPTLDIYIPSADQALGCADVTGKGHARHLGFLEALAKRSRIVELR